MSERELSNQFSFLLKNHRYHAIVIANVSHVGGNRKMNGKSAIVFFLSEDKKDEKDKNAENAISYKMNEETFLGHESTDAGIQYLLWKAAENGEPVEKIITLVSDTVREKTWGSFQRRVERWIAEDERLSFYKGKKIEFVDIEYDETQNDTGKRAAKVYYKISEHIFQNDEKMSVYMDCTGGLRDTTFLMIMIIRYLEYHGMPCKEVVYSKMPLRKKVQAAVKVGNPVSKESQSINKEIQSVQKETQPMGEICQVNNVYRMFQLLNGVDQFTRTGNADLLKLCYQENDNPMITKLLDTIVEFSHEMSLCNIKRIDEILPQLNTELKTYTSDSTDDLFECVFTDMVKLIRKKFGMGDEGNLSYLQLISWCVENNMLQQALVLYIEKMPEYYVEKGVFLENNSEFMKDYKIPNMEVFEKKLKEIIGIDLPLNSMMIEEIKDERIKVAFKRINNFIKTYYDENGKRTFDGKKKVYNEAQIEGNTVKAVEIESKNKNKLINSIYHDRSLQHYFLYHDEENYYYTLKPKYSIKSFYFLEEKKYENNTKICIPNLMSADVLKYYFVLKLIRNQVSHAGGGDGYEDDIYAQKLYENKYNIKMDTFEDVKALLQKGIEISKTAIEYVKQHAEINE